MRCKDFSILARQVRIKIDNEMNLIDMVLYYRGISFFVSVDLKIGKHDCQNMDQMNKYMDYYIRNRQYVHKHDTIRLLISEYEVKSPGEDTIKKL